MGLYLCKTRVFGQGKEFLQMRKCKRLLSVTTSLLILASSFALPYGVTAEGTDPVGAYPNADPDEPYYVVGRFQDKGDVTTTQSNVTENTGSDAATYPNKCSGGDVYITAKQAIDLTGWDTSTLAVMMDVTTSRQDGVTGAGSLTATGNQRFTVRNGNANVIEAVATPYLTKFTTNYGNRAGDTIRYVIPWDYQHNGSPIRKRDDTTVTSLYWAVYNDSYKQDIDKNGLYDDAYGLDVKIENARIVDLSRDGSGEKNGMVAMVTQDSSCTTNSGGLMTMAYSPLLMNVAGKADLVGTLDPSKLRLEYEVSVSGDGDPTYVHNSDFGIKVGDTEIKSTWPSGVLSKTDTWYSYSKDLSAMSGFSTNLDFTNIGQVRFWIYNDNDGNNNHPPKAEMTLRIRNVRIVHSDVADLQAEFDKARNYVYEVDDAAAAYEAAIADARTLFTDPTTIYTDFTDAISSLAALKGNLNGFREVTYDVANFPTAEQVWTSSMNNSSGKGIFMDWKGTSQPADITDGETYTAVAGTDPAVRGAIGANRYLTATVTLSRNEAYTGDLALAEGAELPKLSKLDFRLRSPDSADKTMDTTTERRTDTYTMYPVSSVKNADGSVTYTMELLLDDSKNIWTNNSTYDRRLDWSRVNRIWGTWTFESEIAAKANNSQTNIKMSVDQLKLVNKTAQAIDAAIEELAGATFPDGKYTAVSMADYLACQADAKALMASDSATLQEKNAVLKAAAEAKSKLEAVLKEYVQFGVPETVTTWTNTGIENQHMQSKSFAVTRNNITGSEDFSKLQLRMEIMVTRDDGEANVTNAIVNGNVNLGGSPEMKKTFGSGTGSLLGNATAGKWNTIYINLSDFNDCSIDKLSSITRLALFGYNDLRGSTSNPGITVSVRNAAIIDGTNSDLLAKLKAAFDDVTDGGTKEYTPSSLAAYQAVYDQWYPVYKNVDLTQADAAIAAMADALKQLVCVDPMVMTFSGWEKTINNTKSSEANLYADWSGADQGVTDISIRNRDNLRLRFDLTFAALGETPLPETLTVGSMRLAIRKQAGNPEYSLEWGNAIKTLDPSKTNSIDLPFAGVGGNNEDGQIRDILMWMHINEIADMENATYSMTISNARVVDVTKDNMAEALRAAATISLEDLGRQDGVVYSDTGAENYKAAQAAALELLKAESPTYVQLADAQKAIDDAKASLMVMGHTVMTFSKFNGVNNWMYGNAKTFYADWKNADQGITNLSRYDLSKLVLRMNVSFMTNDGQTADVQPETMTLKTTRLGLRSVVDGQNVERNLTLGNQNIKWDGNNSIEVPLSTCASDMDWSAVRDLIWIFQLDELVDSTTENPGDLNGKYRAVIDNARIVDVTAEEKLGRVNVTGNGAVAITGDLVYGGTDTLTAATTSANSTFVGWNVNASFNRDNSVSLPVSGSERVSAYYVNADETAVIYYGKYNKVLGVQVVKTAGELTAPAIPDIYGYKAAGWDTPAEGMEALVESGRGGTAAVTAVYEADTDQTLYTITLTNAQRTNGSETENLMFDTRIEVKAMPVEGQQFSHWELDGMAVGYEETYSFYVSGNNAVTAVYTSGEAAKPVLAVGIKQTLMMEDTASGTYTISMIGQTYIPVGDTVLEYGLVYAPNETIIGDLGSYEAGLDYLRIVSSSRMANRQYIIHLTNVKPNRTRYGMAYVTVKHADGSVETLYSTVKSITTPVAVPAA